MLYDPFHDLNIQGIILGFIGGDQVDRGNDPMGKIELQLGADIAAVCGIVHHAKMFPIKKISRHWMP